MIRSFLFFIFLLNPFVLSLHCWGQNPEFSGSMSFSKTQIPSYDSFTIEGVFTSPKGYTVDKALLRKNLQEYLGVGPSPLILRSEKKFPKNGNTEKVLYTIEPGAIGNYEISFGEMIFVSEGAEQKIAGVLSEVFPIEIIEGEKLPDYKPEIAPLLSLSTRIPITVDSNNRKEFLENPSIQEKENERNLNIFLNSKKMYRAIALLIITGIALYFVARNN